MAHSNGSPGVEKETPEETVELDDIEVPLVDLLNLLDRYLRQKEGKIRQEYADMESCFQRLLPSLGLLRMHNLRKK